MEKMNKEAGEEESFSGKSESEGEEERVAVVCKRACRDFPCGVSERVLEKGLEEKVVDSSGE